MRSQYVATLLVSLKTMWLHATASANKLADKNAGLLLRLEIKPVLRCDCLALGGNELADKRNFVGQVENCDWTRLVALGENRTGR